MLQNVLLLYNSKKVFLQVIKLILNSNYYSIVSSYPNICYFIKFFIKEFVFHKQLGRYNSRTDLPNLFLNDSALLVKVVLLTEYRNNSQVN